MVSPARRERHFHRIVEPAARQPLESCAVRPHAPDSRSQPVVRPPVLGMDVEAVPSVREVQVPVGAEDRTVQAGGIRREIPSRDHYFPDIGPAVVVSILETEQVGRRGDVQAAAIPDGPSRQGQFVRKDGGAVVHAVAVAILQQPDDVIGIPHHLRRSLEYSPTTRTGTAARVRRPSPSSGTTSSPAPADLLDLEPCRNPQPRRSRRRSKQQNRRPGKPRNATEAGDPAWKCPHRSLPSPQAQHHTTE